MSEAVIATKSLAAKLAEVMDEVESVAKRGHNDHFGYDFATEADVSAAIRGGLAKRKIMLLPSITDIQDQVITTKGNQGEKTKIITTVRMVFTFIDGESGEREDRPWAGRGEDAADKGLAKAITGGNKYFCLKAFQIPTGDDPERESHPKQKQQRQQSRREVTTKDGARVDAETGEQVSTKPKSSAGDFISAKQQAELIKAGHKAGWSASDFASWLKAQGYGEWAKIPAADYKSAMTVMESGAEPVGGIQ
jgi:hypothetical protein